MAVVLILDEVRQMITDLLAVVIEWAGDTVGDPSGALASCGGFGEVYRRGRGGVGHGCAGR